MKKRNIGKNDKQCILWNKTRTKLRGKKANIKLKKKGEITYIICQYHMQNTDMMNQGTM